MAYFFRPSVFDNKYFVKLVDKLFFVRYFGNKFFVKQESRGAKK